MHILIANNCVFIYYYYYFLFIFAFVLLWRLLTINERAAANKKLCESQNRQTARYALHEGTEKADEEGDGDGDVDRGSNGNSSSNSSTQAKPNGVHTNPRAVCVCEVLFVCVCICMKDCWALIKTTTITAVCCMWQGMRQHTHTQWAIIFRMCVQFENNEIKTEAICHILVI